MPHSDLHYVRWDGSTWSADNELTTNTGEVKNQPFVFIYDQDGLLVEPNDAPVNTIPATQNTAIDTAAGLQHDERQPDQCRRLG